MAVVVAFFICWAPNHAQRIWAVYLPSPPPLDYPTSFVTLNYLSGILYYINCTVNPILYQFMSRQFRQAFWVSKFQHSKRFYIDHNVKAQGKVLLIS